MPAIEVRNASPKDLAVCADLLASRHRRDSARLAFLDPGLGTSNGAAGAIESLLSSPRASTCIAERSGKPIGFLLGERQLLDPREFASLFIPPHSISVPVEGHAVAEGEDAVEVYRALYAELAGRWAFEGFFTHRIGIPAGDPAVQEAWLSLGFGRYMTAATRPAANPVANPRPRALSIERASPEDIDDVVALSDELMAWHWTSPMFWPTLHLTDEAAREFNLAGLRAAETPFFIAYEDGRPIAMQSFLRPGFTPPIINREADVYLFEGVVDRGARGGGIGASLLEHTMAWAAGAGFESCTLHFASGNLSGAPFWLAHGFVPVEHTMERTIDSRVTWARPRV